MDSIVPLFVQCGEVVYIVASLLNPTTSSRSCMERSVIEKEHVIFNLLPKALTSPNRLC